MRVMSPRSFLCLCALVVVLFPGRLSAVTSLNLAETFAPIKAKLAAGQQADILFLGDSLTLTAETYLPFLRTSMQNLYGNGGAGWQGFSVWTGLELNQGWTKGMVNQDTFPYHSLDGLWAETSEGPYPPLYTAANYNARSSHIQLQYIAQPEGGSFEMTLPGGAKVMLDTYNEFEEVRTWEYTFTGASRLIRFQAQGDGLVTILGENNTEPLTNPTTPGIRLHRAANGGWGINNFLHRGYTFDQQIPLIHPDLIYVWLGQNDQGYDRTTYPPKISQLLDRLAEDAPDAKVVLVGTYATTLRLESIVQGLEDLARERGVGFIDIYHTAGDYVYFNSNHLQSDGLHLNAAGGAYLADILLQAWLTDGASLQAGVRGDFSGDGLVNVQDINGFIAALGGAPSSAKYGDLNWSYAVDVQDINPFIALLAGGGSAGAMIVPEPAGAAMILVGAMMVLCGRRGGGR